jgi:tetratricopeptide (TPR) repeat protein
LSYNYLLIGDYTNLNKWMQTIRQAGRPDQATLVRALDSFVEARYDDSARDFRLLENASTESYRRFGFAGLARVQAEREDYEAALKTLSEEGNILDPLQSPTERASLSIDRAAIHCTLKAFEQCFQDIDQALRSDSSPENLLLASTAIGEAEPSMPKAMVVQALRRLHDMQARLPREEIGTIYNLARNRISGEIYLVEGDPKQAVLDFRKADALDAPLRARDYLARGLVASAAQEKDIDVAIQLREEAWRAYAKVALRPVIAWRRPFDYPPGFVVREMRNFVQLSRALHHIDAKEQSVEAAIAGLRGASVPPAHPSTNSAHAAATGVSPQPSLK